MTVNYFGLFFGRLWTDLRHKEMLPIKLLFFINSSTILALYPYLTIHMRELGINVEETAIMSAIVPVIGILMPPLAGLVADKIGNFKVLMASFSFISGISALLLLLVPPARVNIAYPNDIILGVSCNSTGPLSVSLYEDLPCKLINHSTNTIDIKMQSCGYVCHTEKYSDILLHSKSYDLEITDPKQNEYLQNYRYSLTEDEVFVPLSLTEALNNRTLNNNEYFTKTIRKLSKNSYFFPSESFDLNCEDSGNYKTCSYELFENSTGMSIKAELIPEIASPDDTSEDIKRFKINLFGDSQNKTSINCSPNHVQNEANIIIPSANASNITLEGCQQKCIATSFRKQLCSNNKVTYEKNVSLTFWTYLIIRIFLTVVGGTVYAMFEGAVIAFLREYKADYGLQKVYASFGGMIASPLSGWLLDFASQGKGYTDFRPIFFLYAGLKTVGAIFILFINLEFKNPAKSVVSDVLAVINVELVSLFVVCFLIGSAWGYTESFLFWLIQDLGGSKSLMGLTLTVGGIVGIPLLVLSGPLIKKIGHANIVFIGLLTFAVRLLGYSLIYNPWLCLIFEAMECLTQSLCLTAAIMYAAKLSTPTTDTTVQGVFGGLYYGVGKATGSLIGGYLIKFYGIRTTFQLFSVAAFIFSIIYLMYYHLYMKKRSVWNKENPTNEKEDIVSTGPNKTLDPTCFAEPTLEMENTNGVKNTHTHT